MSEREQLEEAIAALEVRRDILGEAVVEKALEPLRDRLAALMAESEQKSDTDIYLETPLAGERRVVSILFSDVKGSTSMAERFDPEEWAGIIQPALGYLTGPVRRHGGTVAEVRGDGILAFFGAPVAHEDDPQRSVIAGLEILEGIGVFHERIQRERGLDFEVRVGIHTGLVVVGEVGTGEQVEYTAIGDAVNLAARMEQTARPGTVQISEQTYRFVEQHFECLALGEIKVKGKRQPLRTYRVIGLKKEIGPLRGLERQGLHSPLVGRETEFTALRGCLDRLIQGQGGIVGIFGEAGIGKSRLVSELRQIIPPSQFSWLEGHTLSYGQSIPYWPFQEILRRYLDITNHSGEHQARDKLVHKLTALFPDNSDEILPYLATLLALPVWGDYVERVQYLDGEALGKQVFLAARRFFERLANVQPVVLVFEDLHWMDEASAVLLEHLLPLVEQAPLLVIGLSRPDPQVPAVHLEEVIAKEYSAHYTIIQLSPLSPGDSVQLVHNLVEIVHFQGRLREMIVGKAEGNPFFLEEILRALIDLGAIQRDPAAGYWQATPQIEKLTIPDSIQGVIQARLDRLEEEVKEVLRVAAVIGRSFLYRVLKAVDEAGGRLDEYLVELQKIELIQEKQQLPELEYVFKHALAQESVYKGILLRTRRELHAKVGQAVESLFADRLEEFYGLLAHHYAKAEAWEQAQAYLMKAADQAGRMAADAEALAHYQQAKAAYALAFGERWDPVERAALERKMGEALFRRGEHAESFGYFRQALAYLGHPLPKVGWLSRVALLWEFSLHLARRLIPGLFPVNEPGPAAEEEFHIYQTMGLAAVTDPELFLLLAFRALNFCERNSLPFGIAIASAGLGIIIVEFLNLPRLAEYYIQRAVRLAEQLQRPDASGLAYAGQMELAIARFELDTALELGGKAASSFREAGNLLWWTVPMYVAASIPLWQGDFSLALAYGQELVKTGQDSAIRLAYGAGMAALGLAEQHIGRLSEAIGHLEEAIEIAEAAPIVFLRGFAGNELGECYLRQGKWQDALEVLEANRRFIAEHNLRRGLEVNTELYIGLAGTYLLAAEKADPMERAAWLNKARRACRAALKWGRAFRPGKPEALRLQGRYLWLKENTVQAQRWWQKSLVEAEALGMLYEQGLTHLEIGQRLDQHASLEKAEEIFDRVGAELDLARSRELLSKISTHQ
jgi:class 3 adenylate cyclase/tetratricopeptide (TPR) repeat protein